MGIPESAIEDMAYGAMGQTRLLANNPRRLTRDDAVQIYRNAAVRPGSKPLKEKKAQTARAAAR